MRKLSTEEFIKNSINIHGDLYGYNYVSYINNTTKVDIECKKHGIFSIIPRNHTNMRMGCPKCSVNYKTTEDFIKQAIEVHGDKYGYSNSIYSRAEGLVDIICPIHGLFQQKASTHTIRKHGCPYCGGTKKKNNKEFILKSDGIHGGKYDYSLSNYENIRVPVDIICKIHGVFKQTPSDHFKGSGCPSCNSSKGENTIEIFLKDNNIEYLREYRFDNCKDKRKLPFDFYLPNMNCIIEFHGDQHYNSYEYFGGLKTFENIQRRDKIKQDYCLENNIKYVEINKDNIDNLKYLLDLDS